jgi:hypothetical protein
MTEAELHAEHRRALLAWDATLDCASRNLAASKKLSREVEQALRKIREGLGVFNDYWNKTLQAPARPARWLRAPLSARFGIAGQSKCTACLQALGCLAVSVARDCAARHAQSLLATTGRRTHLTASYELHTLHWSELRRVFWLCRMSTGETSGFRRALPHTDLHVTPWRIRAGELTAHTGWGGVGAEEGTQETTGASS